MDVVLRSATNFLPNASAITGSAPPRVELMLPPDVLPDRRDKYRSFLPEADAKLTALLKGLACSAVVNLESTTSGVRAIRIGNNAKFLLGGVAGDTIYERQFYPELVSAIRGARRRVLLLSNPGTGKSVFQFYLLARYLNPSLFKDIPLPRDLIKFGPEAAPKVVIRHTPLVGMEVWFLEQQIVHLIDSPMMSENVFDCFDPATTVYFFEPGKSKNIEPFASENRFSMSTFATVSPDRGRYNEFVKVAGEIYMPVFTEEELLAIGRDMRTRPDFDSTLRKLYSDDEIRDRFATFNGIIRHVLPQDVRELQQVHRQRTAAFDAIDVVKFLSGSIEDRSVSHFAAIYVVFVNENGKYDFFTVQLSPVNQEVTKILRARLKKISLDDRIFILQQRSETKVDKYGTAPAVFEGVVADQLSSTGGVNWRQRSSTVSVGKTTEPPPLPLTSPLVLKLNLRTGAVPIYEDMVPMVLYKSYNVNFPFCDLVYKEHPKDGGEGRVVCIQVSLEANGKREVKAGAFQKFCARMGWGEHPSKEQVDRISYVYCPDPAVADKAKVTFEAGVGIDKYTVWCVNTDYSSGT
jgi:hypothetical protein